MKAKLLAFSGALLALVAGCQNPETTSDLRKKIITLNKENKKLSNQINQLTTENRQLKKQLDTLSAAPDAQNPDTIYKIQSLNITDHTNIYDKDENGTKEKLIVYLQTIDSTGDVIKAAGSVEVQLWNLNKKSEGAHLATWDIQSEGLKKLYFDGLINTYYRLTFDVGDKIEKFEEPLTVKVSFTDYLTGRVFRQQKVIKPLKP